MHKHYVEKTIAYVSFYCLIFISAYFIFIDIFLLLLILFGTVFPVSHIYNWLVEIKEKQSYLIKTQLNASITGTHPFCTIK